jgi:hypothetical protein
VTTDTLSAEGPLSTTTVSVNEAMLAWYRMVCGGNEQGEPLANGAGATPDSRAGG